MRSPIRSRAAIIVAGAFLTFVPLIRSASAVTTAECTNRIVRASATAGDAHTITAILSGCTPVASTGGRGVAVTDLATHISKTTWAGNHGTTIERVSAQAESGPNRCPANTDLFVITGRVIGGSGAAMTVLSVGARVSVRVCVHAHGPATVEPGSPFSFHVRSRHRDAPTTTTAARPAPTAPTTTTARPAPTAPTTTTPPTGSTAPPAVALPAGLAECPAASRTAMITLVNRDRHGTGNLPALVENTNLDWAARKHSVMMASTSNMTHNGWDTEIHDSHYVVGAGGWTGQNIAWMSPNYSPDSIESGFFNEVPPDDGHRLNILNTKYHNIGIGCIINNNTHAYWWSQDFGS